DVAHDGNVFRDGALNDFLFKGKSGADADEINVLEERNPECPGDQLSGVVLFPGRLLARVGGAHDAAVPLHPTRDREPRVAEAEHEHALAAQRHRRGSFQQRIRRLAHHLSLSVESPKSTSIMVMIQKRTTTCDSFQPSSS